MPHTLSAKCTGCGNWLNQGFARCATCGTVRSEFEAYRSAIGTDQDKGCIISGAETDVVLPNGDPLWAPYFLDFIEAGWLTSDFRYTEKFFAAHPGW
jgi:hypothetical protein